MRLKCIECEKECKEAVQIEDHIFICVPCCSKVKYAGNLYYTDKLLINVKNINTNEIVFSNKVDD